MSKKIAERRPIIRLALSRAEVALSIGVSVTSVDQMVAEGALPPPRKWHSRKLWIVSELEAHLCELPVEDEQDTSKWIDLVCEAAENRKTKGERRSLIAVTKDSPIDKYYQKIGFDPKTMDDSDLARLQEAADAQWKASIPGTPLNKREQKALAQFRERKPGVLIHWKEVVYIGADTSERLEARGFIEVRYRGKSRDQIEGYILTDSGFAAAQSMSLNTSGSR